MYTQRMASSPPIDPDVSSRIQELTPEARKARRQHGDNDPKVLASAELTEIFKDLHTNGVSIPTIAKASGMTYHSVSARIKK